MHPLYDKAEQLSQDVVDAFIEVLRTLGAGLLESIYETCLRHELELRGHRVKTELVVPVKYKGISFPEKLRVDLLVDDCLVVELKAIEGAIRSEHKMQLLSYMHLLDVPLGLVLNAGATNSERVKRVILTGAASWSGKAAVARS
ncbi:MAG: GxxExxY protein [Kiritimatiellae bacterium]|nr:GxxExxY protein [Kiritimatiellia bacterium]